MPLLNINAELGDIYKYPSQSGISSLQKIIIAENICVVISEIHKAGYIFGDFNPRNIGVDKKNGTVAFLDTDSYHVVDTSRNKTYRCNVIKPGYTAPELLERCANHVAANPSDKSHVFAKMRLPTFTKETDNFALAIHIFRLLMNGYAPFGGIPDKQSPSQASPGTDDTAVRRDNYCFKPGFKHLSVAIPPLDSFPNEISDLFTRAFISGKRNPKQRPFAVEWHSALERYEKTLVTCPNNKLHQYDKKNSNCPLCEADYRWKHRDSGLLSQKNWGVIVQPPVQIPTRSRGASGKYKSSTHGNWWMDLSAGVKIAIVTISISILVLGFGIFNGWFGGKNILLTTQRALVSDTSISENTSAGSQRLPTLAPSQHIVQTQSPQTSSLQSIPQSSSKLTDIRDGKVYKTVTIGSQTWMAENLNYKIEKSSCYENDVSNCNKYGRLYDWSTAMKACPVGWHLPTHDEWTLLVNIAGGPDTAGAKLKSKSPGWNGKDIYSFSALPGGFRRDTHNYFYIKNGYWWTATEWEFDASSAYRRYIDKVGSYIIGGTSNKSYELSVRCVQDAGSRIGNVPLMPTLESAYSSGSVGTLTDKRDGKTYRTMKIGKQTWMAENLNYQMGKSLCYDNNPANCSKYGRLYNWDIAKKACPTGWHLPTSKEWDELVNFIGGGMNASMKLKSKPPSWNGTDDYGFSALPSGDCRRIDEGCDFLGWQSNWWTATKSDFSYAYIRGIQTDDSHVTEGLSLHKSHCISVRCVQN
jgi:uncharacterized protein (TIGR02145 family)